MSIAPRHVLVLPILMFKDFFALRLAFAALPMFTILTNVNLAMCLQVGPTVEYCQRIGNSYTASSFVNLMCLIEQQREQLEGKSIGVFSYGSGALATLYTLEVC
jgi:3-hydroxy-3-methylglutaryl CoA synthase